ncbi:MAG TPA: alkaline phosphatase family protein, partial [Acidimicrobiia bacterium]|nr:alkaline phosphatase family protein [Acidimicrobiia bacterium]
MGAESATRHWPPGGDITSVVPLDLLGYPADEAVLPPLTAAVGSPADLVVGYFGSIDTTSHIYGPDSAEAIEAYRSVDKKVGQLNEVVSPDWEEWVVVVVSDHVQDTVEGPGIDLRVLFPDDRAGIVVDEGSAALVSGLAETERLAEVEGVAGWRSLGDGSVLAWSDPGRYFGPLTEPVFRGIHGAEHTRTQLALVSGGSPSKQPLAAEVKRGPVPATYWSGAIEELLGGR